MSVRLSPWPGGVGGTVGRGVGAGVVVAAGAVGAGVVVAAGAVGAGVAGAGVGAGVAGGHFCAPSIRPACECTALGLWHNLVL